VIVARRLVELHLTIVFSIFHLSVDLLEVEQLVGALVEKEAIRDEARDHEEHWCQIP
jgi:hypothetical protein